MNAKCMLALGHCLLRAGSKEAASWEGKALWWLRKRRSCIVSAGRVGITRLPPCAICPTHTEPFRAEISCGVGQSWVQGHLTKGGSILEHFQPVLMAFGTDGPLDGCLRGQRVPRKLSMSNKLVNILPGLRVQGVLGASAFAAPCGAEARTAPPRAADEPAQPSSEHTAPALGHQSLAEREILVVRPRVPSPSPATREDTGRLACTGLWAEQQRPSSSLVPRSSPYPGPEVPAGAR